MLGVGVKHLLAKIARSNVRRLGPQFSVDKEQLRLKSLKNSNLIF